MFRSILCTFLLVTYLFSMIGITGSIHYCGGMMASIDFIVLDEHNCPCGEMMMDSDCCKDEFFQFKVEDTHISDQTSQVILPVYAIIETNNIPNLGSIQITSPPEELDIIKTKRKPPDINLYILFESYLI